MEHRFTISADEFQTLYFSRIYHMFETALKEKDEELCNQLLLRNSFVARLAVPGLQRTLLHAVSEFGTPEIAIRLIELGADVNAQDSFGQTALHKVAETNNEMVETLINAGANISIIDDDGMTPLLQGLFIGSESRVKILLSKFLPKNFKNIYNSREVIDCILNHKDALKLYINVFPLLIFFAAKNCDEETVQLVLNECQKSLRDRVGDPEIYMSNRTYRNEVFISIIKDPKDINSQDPCGRTALHCAVRAELPEVARYLINLGADVNATTYKRYTPLHIAALLQNEEIFEILLNAGAEVNVWGLQYGEAPLNLVCGTNSGMMHITEEEFNENPVFNVNLIERLLKKGAIIEVTGHRGISPFHEVCQTGRLDLVELLLKSGADIHFRDHSNLTALHHAVLGRNVKIVNLLLEMGSEADALNVHSITPLLYTLNPMCTPWGDDYDETLKSIKMIELLADYGANVNVRDAFCDSALYLSLKFQHIDISECLLNLNANIKERGKFKHSIPFRLLEAEKLFFKFEVVVAFMALKRHELADHFVRGSDESYLDYVAHHFGACKLELEKMKRKSISEERWITYYNLLTKDICTIMRMTEHEVVMEGLESGRYKVEFPFFAYLIEKRVERIKSLRGSVNKTVDFLQGYWPKLPTVVNDNVFGFLEAGDFRNFERALSTDPLKIVRQAPPKRKINFVVVDDQGRTISEQLKKISNNRRGLRYFESSPYCI